VNHFLGEPSEAVARWRTNLFRVPIFGHVLDGVGTAVAFGSGAEAFGLDALGYGEKHPVSEWLLQNLGSGYWFIAVKYVLILLVLYFFTEEFEEEDPVFFNVLLVAVIAVGLGPGVRDLVRVTFGV
jgi:uncharacterized membrane protein